ncbi:MAG TPA: MFS transporter [Candidatus Binatia bacterium]|nr:MFS transporter [Candidatus Binatia bacterium]
MRRDRRRIVILAYVLLFAGGGVWMPYFPLYLSHLGFTGWQVGMIFGLQPALRWTSAIGWAYAADRWRIRHQLLVGAAIAGALCFLGLLVVRSFAMVLAVTAAIALLHAPLIPMVDAAVMDHLERLGGDYGRLRMWGSIAFVAFAVIGAPLVHAFSVQIVPLVLLLPLPAMVIALARLPREQRGHAKHFRAPWALLTPPLTAFLASAFLIQLSCGAFSGFFALHTAALGLSDAVPGLAWGCAVAAEVAILFAGGRILERVTPSQLVIVSLLVSATRWAITAWARDQTLVVLLQMTHAFTFGAFHLAALLLLSRLVPPESSTGGQALYGLVAFGIGGSSGLALAGALVDRIGTAGVFGFEAGVTLLGLVPALWLHRLMRKTEIAVATVARPRRVAAGG